MAVSRKWARRLAEPDPVGGGWNVMTSIVGPGDLTGDGKADALARDSSGTLWTYPGTGAVAG